jgi:hypothetical protein
MSGRGLLGPQSLSFLYTHFARSGWPDHQPPNCPTELHRISHEAIGRLLSRVAPLVTPGRHFTSFEPGYVRDAAAGDALGGDLVTVFSDEVLAIATADDHWATPANEVNVNPPPPARVALVTSAEVTLPVERTIGARHAFQARRLTIIGGLRSTEATNAVVDAFAAEVRWIESEPGSQPDLKQCRSLTSEGDVVCCVVGTKGVVGLGHSASEKIKKMAANRGTPVIVVETPSKILAALVERFGGV